MRTASAQWLRMNARRFRGGRRTRASRLMLVLAATCALALSGPLHDSTFAAQAGRIDSIAPSCASIGAAVTITGIGFGSGNVQITRPEVNATGDSAFINSGTEIMQFDPLVSM